MEIHPPIDVSGSIVNLGPIEDGASMRQYPRRNIVRIQDRPANVLTEVIAGLALQREADRPEGL